ncbi:heme utilization protein [Magnetospirillum sp. ME-1]|uniref:heme utilization protein n=1 Tax=Magnetospirillum sp. ME-1 TaxID=1639348 RepID=UPI000A17C668|nr:heme utilization protein [Magnetospirillum sp. ME-1]ARJ64476.1 heme utilization protein [Magnetospirillum sp. ME-1]
MAALSYRSAALALALSLAALPALGGTCGTPEEVKAAQLRQFHYQLQVAALNCRGDDPSLPAKWSSYVHRHGGTMSVNANVMRGYFTRTGKGVAGFDRYNTVLTNRESVRVHETEGYCEINQPLFEKAIAANGQQLATLASETIGKPMDIAACAEPKKAEAASEKKSKKVATRAE